MSDSKKNFWLTPNGLSAIVLIGIAMYFLLAEHRAHFFSALPLLILLLCPFIHFFMHRGGHGSHGSHGNPKEHERKHIDEEKEDDQQ